MDNDFKNFIQLWRLKSGCGFSAISSSINFLVYVEFTGFIGEKREFALQLSCIIWLISRFRQTNFVSQHNFSNFPSNIFISVCYDLRDSTQNEDFSVDP